MTHRLYKQAESPRQWKVEANRRVICQHELTRTEVTRSTLGRMKVTVYLVYLPKCRRRWWWPRGGHEACSSRVHEELRRETRWPTSYSCSTTHHGDRLKRNSYCQSKPTDLKLLCNTLRPTTTFRFKLLLPNNASFIGLNVTYLFHENLVTFFLQIQKNILMQCIPLCKMLTIETDFILPQPVYFRIINSNN